MEKEYSPGQKILDKYADLLVNCALNKGEGVKPNETIFLQVPECAKPLLVSLQKVILKSKANIILQYLPENISKDFFNLANKNQLTFFPKNYLFGRTKDIDHSIGIISESNLRELTKVNPEKIMLKAKTMKPYRGWIDKKENQGKFTWTLALYPTQAMANEANLSLKEYWSQIITGCYLNEKDPIKKWKQIFVELNRLKNALDKLNITYLRLVSKNTDIKIGLGQKKKWIVAKGENIPSFEVFISPDWRKVDGYIYFNQPLYRNGNIVKDIYLEFKDGEIIKAKARKGQKFLRKMINTDEGSKRVGEFSLTDKRLSKINKFMAETLFDENFGGKFGNTHLALGRSFAESFSEGTKKFNKSISRKFGFNESAIHTDIISTTNRKVYATLQNGKEILLYKDGKFQI